MGFRGFQMTDHSVYLGGYSASNFAGSAVNRARQQRQQWGHGRGPVVSQKPSITDG